VFIWYEIVKCASFFIENIHQTFPILNCCWFELCTKGESKAMGEGAIIFHKGVKAIKPGATNRSSKERKVTEGKEGNKLLLDEHFFCFYS
jgi:hypothetical protein